MSPTAAMNVAATIRLTPGTVISRLTSGQFSASARSAARPARSRRRGSRSGAGRRRRSRAPRSAARARPATPGPCCRTDRVAGGRPFRRRINTAWISFFTRVRARTSCARRASRRRITRVRSSGIHTPSSSPAASSLASVRASSRSVFARAWRIPVSLGETTITRADVRLEDPRDLPRVAGHLQRHPVTRIQALREQLQHLRRASAIRPAERTRPSSTIATSQKSRCTSSPTALTRILLARSTTRENRWANDTDGSALAAQPGKSQGRPPKSPGSHAHRAKRPAQPAFSQRPLSQSPEPKPAPDDRAPSRGSFMPREAPIRLEVWGDMGSPAGGCGHRSVAEGAG